MRMGIPSKGRMAEETMELLNACQLKAGVKATWHQLNTLLSNAVFVLVMHGTPSDVRDI